jgi:surfactin synthase thioesterase subunit
MDKRWLTGQQLDSDAEYRLFCLPYAGAAASAYRGWQHLAPAQLQVIALELPGRGGRMNECPFMRLESLVRVLANALEPALDRPFALFGHSMGGLIAFELARTLRARGAAQPMHLFVSGAAAPGTPPTRPLLHSAGEAELKDGLRAIAGTPQELLDDDELMSLRLPTLRADFCLIETYEYREEPPLATPITVFGGRSDHVVALSALNGWRRQSTGGARLHTFAGDHFFLHSAAAAIMAQIVRATC